LEEVVACAGQEFLMEVDGNSALIVGDPEGILDLQLRPHPVCLLKINIIIILNNVKNIR
jgi:hypothetical protein